MRAIEIARYFISLDDDEGISNLKLQKLLYYAQGLSLALSGKELFKDDVCAWTHGPVCPDVYHEYKRFGSSPIQDDTPPPELKPEQEALLDEVYEVFGQYSAWKLRNMTHEEDPWVEYEKTAGRIPKKKLKEYFLTRVS